MSTISTVLLLFSIIFYIQGKPLGALTKNHAESTKAMPLYRPPTTTATYGRGQQLKGTIHFS